MNALLIVNPKSGRQKVTMPPIFKLTFKKLEKKIKSISKEKTTPEEIVQEVRRRCYKGRIKLRVEFTKHPKHAMELAKAAKNKYNLVIVAGGDGTVNEVINGINNSRTTLVIIPFGTINVLALALGIPLDVKGAAKLITEGKKKKIDLGYAKTSQEGRYYSILLGAGFTSGVMKNVNKKTKKKYGKWAFIITAIKELMSYKWRNIYVKHKSRSVGYFVLLSNTKDYSGEYQIAEKASMTDGLLDLVVINRKDWWGISKILFKTGSGMTNTFLRGEYYQVKKAHIYSSDKLFVQVDGEIIGTTPVKIEIAPKALSVMVN